MFCETTQNILRREALSILIFVTQIIDCSKQNGNLKVGSVDVRLEFEAIATVDANNTTYCLI